MIGAIIGDIVGSRFEFFNVKSTEFELFADASMFTDDTVMTLAVAQAIMDARRRGARLEAELVRNMQRFGRAHPGAGYGGSFDNWLYEDDPQPYNSWGNGSAMRVSSAGWECATLEETVELAAATAAVTHDHPEGIKGAQATAAAIFLARTGADKAGIKRYVAETFGYDLDRTLDTIRPGYTFDVSCQGSVPEAIIAFLESDGFEDAIRRAVSIGGDSDTIAAICGGIAEAFYGVPRELEEEARARLTPDLLAVLDRWEAMMLERASNPCAGAHGMSATRSSTNHLGSS